MFLIALIVLAIVFLIFSQIYQIFQLLTVNFAASNLRYEYSFSSGSTANLEKTKPRWKFPLNLSEPDLKDKFKFLWNIRKILIRVNRAKCHLVSNYECISKIDIL